MTKVRLCKYRTFNTCFKCVLGEAALLYIVFKSMTLPRPHLQNQNRTLPTQSHSQYTKLIYLNIKLNTEAFRTPFSISISTYLIHNFNPISISTYQSTNSYTQHIKTHSNSNPTHTNKTQSQALIHKLKFTTYQCTNSNLQHKLICHIKLSSNSYHVSHHISN